MTNYQLRQKYWAMSATEKATALCFFMAGFEAYRSLLAKDELRPNDSSLLLHSDLAQGFFRSRYTNCEGGGYVEP